VANTFFIVFLLWLKHLSLLFYCVFWSVLKNDSQMEKKAAPFFV